MIKESRDAIRKILVDTFPLVPRIYMNNVPDGFKRPSFYLEYVFDRSDDLSQFIVEKRIMWQIVYFGLVDDAQNVDKLSLLDVLETMEKTFGETAALTGPDGSVFHIEGLEGAKRDKELYMSLTLTAETTRIMPTHETMGEVANDMNIEKEG